MAQEQGTERAPAAPRLRRPGWRDPRLGIGVLLVVAAVLLGAWTFARADRTVEVYRAADALVPGQAVTATDLVVTRVRLDEVPAAYLRPGDLREGDVAVRVVGPGELLPRSAVGAAADVDRRPVLVAADRGLADTLRRGTAVEIWIGANGEAPAPVVRDAVVAAAEVPTGVFAGSDSLQVRVLVPVADLATVLAAQQAAADLAPGARTTLTLVPVSGG